MKLAHALAPLGDDDPTIELSEPITHARQLLGILDANEDRPTMPAPAPQKRSRKRKP